MHTFNFDNQGNLNHIIAGELRAVIQPANIEAYRETWPEAPLFSYGIGLEPSANPLAQG